MQKLNLGTRVEMFSICSSVEYDLKKYIIETNSDIKFTLEMKSKAAERKANSKDDVDILNQLDLGDFVSIISASPYEYGINNDKSRELVSFFEKIIPVRNRVMHTKPLELGDRATLIEVMQYIDAKITWIEWTELKNVREIIENDSSQLLSQKYIGIKEYNPRVFHNLPLPEFDDTGFVGRKRDIKEITELILNKKSQVISVVGNGGMGKTSTVVKILYDLLENPDNPFEAIIWITLKTKTLSNGEFVEIKDSIKSINEAFEKSKLEMLFNENENAMDSVIEFMEVFNVLLVLDNMETVNTGEVNNFLRRVPDKSKVLITSRLGIGEFEVRQKIEGLSKNDAITYFRELSKYYGLELHKQNDEEIYKVINGSLYNNPLSIKWYISGIYSGTDARKMLGHKDDLIEFCISNIFDKLSETSRKILQLFLLQNNKLTYGLIDYYIGENELVLKPAVNELLSTYMIQASSGDYIMNEMSREYISLKYPPDNDFVKEVFAKRKVLNGILQQVKVYSEQAPYNPNTISFNLKSIDEQLATYHLKEALAYGKEKKWDKCSEEVEKAQGIEPDFFEVYKVKAFLEAEKRELYGAIKNYGIALSKCKKDKERARVCYLFSIFYTIKMQDTDSALEFILKAENFAPDSNDILLEKVRVQTFLGKYEDAEILWKEVKQKENNANLRTKNILGNRYLDLKLRQAEILQSRDYIKKYTLIKQAIDELDEVEIIDDKTAVNLLKSMTALAYSYYHFDSIKLIADTLERYSYAISKLDRKNKEKLLLIFKDKEESIDKSLYQSIYLNLSAFKTEASSISNENEGLVVKMTDNYGFISNANYTYNKGLFFSKNNAYEDIKVGDKVSFEIYTNLRGAAAKNIKNIEEL